MVEFDKVTTKGGDKGESSLYDGRRERKDDIIFEALGTLDTLNSYLGLVRALLGGDEQKAMLVNVQETLLRIGSELATAPEADVYARLRHLEPSDVERLETAEKALLDETEIENRFILPGTTVVSAHIDVARTICRETERRIVACMNTHNLAHLRIPQNYINRLADLLFILARYCEQH